MKNVNRILVLITMISLAHLCLGQQLGDPGWVFDESKFDSRFPAMREYAKAGVQGGIPYRGDTPIKQTLSVVSGDNDMANNIQSAINAANASGGGVVLLNNGTYPIRSQITMKSNVILRGQSKNGVLLEVFMRFQGASEPQKKEVFYWQNIQNAGLEDFSMIYNVDYQGQQMYPLDHDWAFNYFSQYSLRSQNYKNERVYHNRANFQYHTVRNIDVIYVRMDGNTRNCWIDNCNFRDSGSALVIISNPSTHITVRNSLMQGAFQKGNNGHGYGINCSGTYVLMVNTTVKNVRHWAIQQGAIYNVVYDCHSETDMNFHQGDLGLNLIEKTKIHKPAWHIWKPFQTGAAYHGDPGQGNMFYDNDVIDGNNGPLYTDQKVYTFNSNREIVPMFSQPPSSGTLYAMKRGGGTTNNPPSVSFTTPTDGQSYNPGDDVVVNVNASDDGSVANVKLYLNGTLVRQENFAPYDWGHTATNDPLLKNMSSGSYTLRALAEDNTGQTAESIISITVGTVSNPVPNVNFTLPANNQSFNEGDDIVVNVTATDNGSVSNVKLYLNGAFVRQENTAPFEWAHTASLDPQLKNMSAGSYTLRAVAEDNQGATGESTISVTVTGTAPTPQNVALNQPVTASSQPEPANSASNAVDNDTNTRWSASGFPQWLEVDLGSVKSISKTELVCFSDRAYQFVVEAKTTAGGSYTQIVNRSANTTGGSAANPITDNFSAVNARYVRITVSGASGYTGNWVSLMEFRVFGVPGAAKVGELVASSRTDFVIYPNPFEASFRIQLPEGHTVEQVSLVNMNGEIVYDERIKGDIGNEWQVSLDDGTLSSGLYFMRIVESNQTHTVKLSRR